jgi:hypothetical protein
MTAGPAVGTVSLSTKKIPVPMVEPTPNMVSWNGVMPRFRCLCSASPPLMSRASSSTGFLRRRRFRKVGGSVTLVTRIVGFARLRM